MKIPFHVFITAAVLTLFSVSCGLLNHLFIPPPDVHPESCSALYGNTSAGYVIEIQGIPDIKQVDISRTVRAFSRRINPPTPSRYTDANKLAKGYTGVGIFYDWKEKAWFASRDYYFPNETPSKSSEDFIFGGGLRSKKIQIDQSKDKLRLWINSYEVTCRSSVDERISVFKNRIGFLSFRLYYNDRIYDSSHLLRFEKGKMSINDKVKVIKPKSAKTEKLYPPFFVKNPAYTLSPGRHVIQFSDLKLVPAKEVKTK